MDYPLFCKPRHRSYYFVNFNLWNIFTRKKFRWSVPYYFSLHLKSHRFSEEFRKLKENFKLFCFFFISTTFRNNLFNKLIEPFIFEIAAFKNSQFCFLQDCYIIVDIITQFVPSECSIRLCTISNKFKEHMYASNIFFYYILFRFKWRTFFVFTSLY